MYQLLARLFRTSDARERTASLVEQQEDRSQLKDIPEANSTIIPRFIPKEKLARLLFDANCKLPSVAVFAISLILATIGYFLSRQVLAPLFAPLCAIALAYIPIAYLQKRAHQRASEFLLDYPSILLAASSSMKAGLTPYLALERAVRLLAPGSLVRTEIQNMLTQISAGMPREEAIAQFAASIRLPELELFRSAFTLVTEHGGRFAPTLHRLALVSKERATLIGSAQVSTASMRMTANFLLVVAPLLVLMVSSRSDNFWDIFLHHPTASVIGSTGIVIILASYSLLRKMSNFRP